MTDGERSFSEFHMAVGQYLNYRRALRSQEPDRILYLAVPSQTYEEFFRLRFIQEGVVEYQLYGVLIHIDLKNNKVWIQYDGTEVGVANELLERGIPREDIVLAYHSPFMRQYDGFAVS